VIEAVNSSGEDWGMKRLCSAATAINAADADCILHAIFSSMDEFSRGSQSDDATVAVLRVH
jgi:serine phosphatase RsbU (regulator of sigma subunit)